MASEDIEEGVLEDLSGSPAPSLYSFNPSVDERHMLRELYGRVVNSYNDTYLLPADDDEHRRLDLQHRIYTIMLGALYPAVPLVRWALRPRRGTTPAILDVGTGSGSWAIDMAREFPHCEVVGIDLVPPRILGDVPANCRFEIDDANLGFPHYRGRFDVIQARAVDVGIRDFPGLLNELAQSLRPSGVLLLGDGEMQLYDEQKRPISFSEPNPSWTHRIFFAAYNAMKNRGGSPDAPSMSPTWLRAIDSLTDVGWHKVFVPIGPWIYGERSYTDRARPHGSNREAANEREKILADMLRTNCLAFISGMGPLLMSEGYLPESVEKMQHEAGMELQELRVRLYSRWSFAWAVKKP
ncbi:hypothetical protein NM688_g3394 [Phlebia brevispora]|uniref:Uncharacterized protein n=1 Tax=Phlebia brevispora TaxID=194682 RepID=A0ACC1T612_9APHY|nr:hypothetical protein NM688_g3394 [Phlebia brevispora]